MWDYPTLCIYISVALVSALLIKKEKAVELTSNVSFVNRYYMLIFLLWTSLATFRYIGYYNGVIVGGMDAPMYKEFFEICRSENQRNLYSYHTESLFQLFTKLVRLLTDDYRIYFAISYGFIVIAYLLFIKEFVDSNKNCFVYSMLFFVYLKSFCAFRTHLAIAILLISIVLINRNKSVIGIVLALSTISIQRGSIFFALFPVFFWVNKRKTIKLKTCLVLIILGVSVGVISQKIAIHGSYSWMMGGAYQKYAQASMNAGYTIDYLKLIFEQLLIIVLFFIYDKNMIASRETSCKSSKYEMLRVIMIYDSMLVPISYVLNIWRGVDYFFLPRLIILDNIISLMSSALKNNNERKAFNMAVLIIIVSCFVFRLSTVYDISALMPYVLD